MTQPTKADLTKAVAKLTEQNAQLRELLAAVRDTAQIPAAPKGQMDDEQALRERRFSQIRNWLKREDFSSPDQVQFLTRLFRGKIEPVTYRPVCDERIPPADGDVLGDYCQLDPGHDGEHSPEMPGVCPATHPSRDTNCTAPMSPHPMPHRDEAGVEWDDSDWKNYREARAAATRDGRDPFGPDIDRLNAASRM
jgi:hypothetical protein